MLGYAQRPEELALGDEMHGVIHTGDLGALDEDGFLRLTGRSNRIAKVYGLRVSLDEVEAAATSASRGAVAAVEGSDQIVLWRLSGTDVPADDVRMELAARFGLNSRVFAVREVDELPVNRRGKVDYHVLTQRLED
jgi:acyl-CoA synthetase (AMP-forming)/AMP-acid ligase II